MCTNAASSSHFMPALISLNASPKRKITEYKSLVASSLWCVCIFFAATLFFFTSSCVLNTVDTVWCVKFVENPTLFTLASYFALYLVSVKNGFT